MYHWKKATFKSTHEFCQVQNRNSLILKSLAVIVRVSPIFFSICLFTPQDIWAGVQSRTTPCHSFFFFFWVASFFFLLNTLSWLELFVINLTQASANGKRTRELTLRKLLTSDCLQASLCLLAEERSGPGCYKKANKPSWTCQEALFL